MLDWPFVRTRFRLLRRRERHLLLGHLNRLSDEDLYHRFLTHVDTAQLRAHIDFRHGDHETIGWFRYGVLRGAIEIFYHDSQAEAGITIGPKWRGQGIGTELVRRALARARMRRMGSFEVLAHRGNYSMICIASKFGAFESIGHGRLIEGLAPDASLPAWFIFDPHQPAPASRRHWVPGFLGVLLERHAA